MITARQGYMQHIFLYSAFCVCVKTFIRLSQTDLQPVPQAAKQAVLSFLLSESYRLSHITETTFTRN